MNNNYSLENLSEIASEIIVSTKNKTLLFYGEMGVGKTTLIKEICKELGVLDNISSPTFSLVNEYQTQKNRISRKLKQSIFGMMSINGFTRNRFWEFIPDITIRN